MRFYLFIYLRSRGCTTLRAMPDSKPTSMPPAERHNSTSEIAWRIQKKPQKTKSGYQGGGERAFLNNSSLGQHRAGCRGETICVVTRPLGEKGAHTMRRLEEATEELSALRVWGRRAARRRGGRSEAPGSPITDPPQVNPAAAGLASPNW